MAIRDTRAGRLAALNQKSHGLAILTPSSSANFRHNRFCAAAVRYNALELPADYISGNGISSIRNHALCCSIHQNPQNIILISNNTKKQLYLEL